MSEDKRGRGRPLKAEEDKKRHHQTVRIRGATRARLEAAAKLSERSISEEIEARIVASFDQPALVDQLAERFTQRVVGLVRADLSGA